MTTLEREYAATEQHLDLLVAKRDKLNALIIQAEEQFALSVYREWQSGALTWDDLNDAYEKLRTNGISNFSRRWAAAGLPKGDQIRRNVRFNPTPQGGYWHGRYPWSTKDTGIPPKEANVVYVLFDDDLNAIYVGSTQQFTNRMRRHYLDGKPFTSWVAHPCDSREHAYELEDRFLKQYKPSLNVKRGR